MRATDFWFFLSLMEDVFPYVFLQYIPLRNKLRLSYGKTMPICSAVLTLQCAGLTALSRQPFYTLDLMLVCRACALLSLAVLTACLTRGGFFQSMFVYSVMLPYMAFLLALSCWLMPLFAAPQAPPYKLSALIRLALTALSCPLALWFGRRTLRPAMRVIDPAIWKYAWLIPFAFTMLDLLSFSNDMELAGVGPMEVVKRLLILLGTVGGCLLLLRALERSAQIAGAREGRRRAESMIELQAARYRELIDRIDEVRRARHDLRHHLAVLRSLAEAGDHEALRKYLSQLTRDLPLDSPLTVCRNDAVDAVMSFYLGEAKAKGIQVEMEFRLDAELGISSTDLCVLLGNLMENAIEACARLPRGEGLISAHGRVVNRSLSLLISNSFDGQLRMDGERYLSRKTNYAQEGLGVASVKALVGRYHGECRFAAKGKVFEAALLIPIGKARITVKIQN